MILNYLAALCSALAVLSGIAAVGSGNHWHFTCKDILKGRLNAVLYIWVIFSTVFSLAHFAALSTFSLEYGPLYEDTDTTIWMTIHSGFAFLMIAAHFLVRRKLTDGICDEYLWGPKPCSLTKP